MSMIPPLPAWADELRLQTTPGSAILSDGEGANLRIDAEGRWRSCGIRGPILQRILDGRVVLRSREEGQDREVRDVGPDSLGALHDEIRERIREVARGLAAGRTRVLAASEDADLDQGRAILSRAADWGAARFEADARLFADIYRPVGILPPDRYRNVVVQPATGCPWNRCAFCEFYGTETYRVLGIEEFREHVRAVRAFFGRALPLRRGVFLGEANALAIGQARLLEVLAVVREELPDSGSAGAFFDPHHAPARGPAEFAELAAAGLSSVAVGMETGSQELLDLLGKGGRVEDTVEAVRAARAGGLAVSVMVLVGPGGERLAEQHVERTEAALRDMDLSPGDIVFLSPLLQDGRRIYPFPVLPEKRLVAETERFRVRLRPATRARISPYRLEEFRYYA
ncbi:MAG: radical SAM protein [Planctomycetes bacterium]|nr:radical SAM protein [Planctomycetota bacterium]